MYPSTEIVVRPTYQLPVHPQRLVELFAQVTNHQQTTGMYTAAVVSGDGSGFVVIGDSPVYQFTDPLDGAAFLAQQSRLMNVISDTGYVPEVEVDQGFTYEDERGSRPVRCDDFTAGDPDFWADNFGDPPRSC